MIGGHASPAATSRFAARFPALPAAGFYRHAAGLTVSSLGMGTYLGAPDDLTDVAYTEAALAAMAGGINWFDTAINYRHTRSVRALGAAIARSAGREEFVVCTKAGFLTPGAVPESLRAEDVVGGMHSMAPDFISDQVSRSRAHLGLETIDVFYLHNPETQLRFVSRRGVEDRLRAAFARLEELVERGWICRYGVATWEGFLDPGQLTLGRLLELATETAGPGHHFGCIQLPYNLAITAGATTLADAARAGVIGVASATLLQGRVLREAGLAEAIAFTRKAPGVAVALIGMSSAAHVTENLGALA